jgi:hypothetical protein
MLTLYMSDNIINCPHCSIPILIEELNCLIFRHGVFIKTNEQISPHASKLECDYYINNKLIFGCGKPFKIIKVNNKLIPEICDYI